jgi:hypothetical protein
MKFLFQVEDILSFARRGTTRLGLQLPWSLTNDIIHHRPWCEFMIVEYLIPDAGFYHAAQYLLASRG